MMRWEMPVGGVLGVLEAFIPGWLVRGSLHCFPRYRHIVGVETCTKDMATVLGESS